MLIDLHAHTRPISWDSDLTPDKLVELAKAAGLDGVCLTEHDAFWDPADAAALSRKCDLLVLPAIELNTEIGHVLTYGLDRFEWGMHRIDKLAEMVEAAGGVMIAAHPYRRYMPWYYLEEDELDAALQRAARNPAFKRCAALEAVHGRASPEQNDFSRRLCELLGMPGTGGSDAHQPAQVGRCATRFERPVRDLASLVRELKAGRFQAVQLREETTETGAARHPRPR
jgi:predicted metal-dependent phosphoesterase TrpH